MDTEAILQPQKKNVFLKALDLLKPRTGNLRPVDDLTTSLLSSVDTSTMSLRGVQEFINQAKESTIASAQKAANNSSDADTSRVMSNSIERSQLISDELSMALGEHKYAEVAQALIEKAQGANGILAVYLQLVDKTTPEREMEIEATIASLKQEIAQAVASAAWLTQHAKEISK